MIILELINKFINFKPVIYDNYGIKINKNAINKKLIAIILPVAIENSLQTFSGIIVMAMIGRFDVVAISSMGVALVVMQVIVAIFRGTSIGEMVFVSRYYGEGNYKKMRSAINQTMITSLIVAVIIAVLLFFYSDKLLFIFNVNNEILVSTKEYLKIIAFGLPFLSLIIIMGGAFQGTGNALKSMNIMLFMNIIYAILSYIIIFGKLGIRSYGLNGAAIAMVIAQIIAAIVAFYNITGKKGVLKGGLTNLSLKLDLNLVKKVYMVGMSSSLESILWLIAIIIVTAVMLQYGPTTFAAYQVATNAEAISYMPAFGFGVAATTLISQAIGAKNNNLAKVYLIQMIKGIVLFTSLCVIAFLVVPEKIIMVLTNNEEVIKLGGKYLFIMAFVEIPLNLYGLFIGALRGMRNIGIPIMISVLGLWCIRVPLILIATYYFKFSVIVSWVIIGIDILFRFILSAYFLKKKMKAIV